MSTATKSARAKAKAKAAEDSARRFVITMENGAGKLTAADGPFVCARTVARAIHVDGAMIPALMALCGLPARAIEGPRSHVLYVSYSVAATKQWFAEHTAAVAAAPAKARVRATDVLRVWRKAEARRIKNEHIRAWKAIVAAGLAEQTVKTINSWRTRGEKHVTAKDCASGAVDGNLMLECAREVVVDTTAKNPLYRGLVRAAGSSGHSKKYISLIGRKIAEAGLDFSIKNNNEHIW